MMSGEKLREIGISYWSTLAFRAQLCYNKTLKFNEIILADYLLRRLLIYELQGQNLFTVSTQ